MDVALLATTTCNINRTIKSNCIEVILVYFAGSSAPSGCVFCNFSIFEDGSSLLESCLVGRLGWYGDVSLWLFLL